MMKKLFLTIILLTVPLTTHAYFSDTQTSVGTMSAGRIAFTMSATTTDLILGTASFTFAINDESTQSPQHTFSIVSSTCGAAAFQFDTAPFSGEHTVTASEVTSPCELTILVEAWQQNFTYNQGGFTASSTLAFAFSDTETASLPPIVFNEVYVKGNNEWIELYNYSNSSYTLEGWRIAELTGGNGEEKYVSIPTMTIPAFSYATVTVSSKFNDTPGDTIRLLDFNSNQIGRLKYIGSEVEENKSFAWNGTDWVVKATPTPNAENFPQLVQTQSMRSLITESPDTVDGRLLIVQDGEESEGSEKDNDDPGDEFEDMVKEDDPLVEESEEEQLIEHMGDLPDEDEEIEEVGENEQTVDAEEVLETVIVDQIEEIAPEESEEDVLETEPVPEPEPEEPESASEVSTDINPEEL